MTMISSNCGGRLPIGFGAVPPNINDGFRGKAPDLGAFEVGWPVPHYGPRKMR